MSSNNVERIKERLSIEEVISWYIKLDTAGKNLKGKCPFHNEKTPSFFVSPDKGYYYCFGCGAKGDLLSFVQQFEGLDFMGSMKFLAERAGIQLEFSTKEIENRDERERLFNILEEATIFFQKGLNSSKQALEYLNMRGVNEKTIENFRIGYISNDWKLLYNYFKSNSKLSKYSDLDLEKVGLIKKIDSGRCYDRFRGRIMFPICDSSGRVIAFSGRILVDDGKSAKYLNSPDTILFNKSNVLYGIDKAKADIRIKNYSILVEGQMDLILSHQVGVKNTVAVSGTALSDTLVSSDMVVNNLGIVKRLSNNIILAFDSDSAGQKASMRSASIALSLGMDVKIASINGGKDPADLILSNPELWKDSLRNSKSVVEFQIDTVLSQNIERSKNKKLDLRVLPQSLRSDVFPFIAPIRGAMEKAHYIKLIQEKTGLSEQSIFDDFKKYEISLKKEVSNLKVKNDEVNISRFDTITRKLFSLLYYIQKNPSFNINSEIYIKKIEEIVSNRYEYLIKTLEPYKDELILEAEILYSSSDLKQEVLKKDLDELLLNFEDDFIRQEFSEIMKLGLLEENSQKLGKLIARRSELDKLKQKKFI